MTKTAKEIIDSVIGAVQKEVNQYSYPVFISDGNEKPDLIATAVIFDLNQSYYLVTASHVLLEVLKSGSQFIIGVNGKYHSIEGEFTYTNHDETDHFDIAYIELSNDFINTSSVSALDESKLMLEANPSIPSISFVHGFPNSINKQSKALRGSTSFKVKAFAYGGVIKSDFTHWSECGKNRDTHTSMTYGKTSNNNIPKHPRGMSGGGLWVVPKYSQPNNFLLDSIFIEYHKKYNITFSTRITHVVQFITDTRA